MPLLFVQDLGSAPARFRVIPPVVNLTDELLNFAGTSEAEAEEATSALSAIAARATDSRAFMDLVRCFNLCSLIMGLV